MRTRLADKRGIAVAVMAAGRSQRFGSSDKLIAPLRGKMLGAHVTGVLSQLPVEHRWVVATDQNHPCAKLWQADGFDLLCNGRAREGLATSVARAADAALKVGASALLVALADMPLVPLSHYERVLKMALGDGCERIVASSDGVQRMPPACFSSDLFDELTRLSGDSGARNLLKRAIAIECEPSLLVDVDDRGDLRALN